MKNIDKVNLFDKLRKEYKYRSDDDIADAILKEEERIKEYRARKKSGEYCKNCIYFEMIDIDFIMKHIGRCRRYPPAVKFPHIEECDISDGTDIEDRYPFVFFEDWCGEFKPKNENER